MYKLFVSPHIAKILDNLKYNELCFGYYETNNDDGDGIDVTLSDEMICNSELVNGAFSAPTNQQVVEWFIEKHKIFIMVYPRDKWNYMVQGIDETVSCSGDSLHGTNIESYHEALKKGILEAFKLIK